MVINIDKNKVEKSIIFIFRETRIKGKYLGTEIK